MAKTETKAKKTTATTEKESAANDAKTFSEAEVKALIAEAVKSALADAAANSTNSTTKTDSNSQADAASVTVMFIAEVSPENVLVIPGYGSLRPTSTLDIPKQEFKGKFMMPLVRKLIDKRHLVILNGLTSDERKRFNCDYKEGEVMSEQVFDHILEFDDDKLISTFKLLCDEHKEFVCRKIITAYSEKRNPVGIDAMREINKLTKGITPDGLLKPVIDDYISHLA